MKRLTGCLSALILVVLTSAALASQGAGHAGHGDPAAHDHSAMDHGSKQMGDTFVHAEMVEGIHAEFQVMDLASMNIKDPDGNTHHIMATFLRDESKMEDVVGKVKVIAPSGREQINTLQHFGSGVFAANFTFDESGKWGVICLFKAGSAKYTVKFWYPHQGG